MAYDHRKAGFPADELVVALPERARVASVGTPHKDRSCGGRRAGLRGPARHRVHAVGRHIVSPAAGNVTALAIAR